MSYNQIIFVFLIQALSIAWSFPAWAKIVYLEKTNHFDIGYDLKTKRDVWKAIRRTGPTLGKRRVLGTTNGRINYKYRLKRSSGRCSVSQSRFSVHVKIKLPTWQRSYQAPQSTQNYFGCVLRTVTIHEKRHAKIWLETAERMENAFSDNLQGLRCDEIKQRAKSIYRRIYDHSRRRQSAFDAAEKTRGRYKKCWRNEPNHGTVESLPRNSGSTPWSKKVARPKTRTQPPHASRQSHRQAHKTNQRPQSEAGSRSRQKLLSTEPNNYPPVLSKQWLFEQAVQFAYVVGWLALIVAAIGGAFFATLHSKLWQTTIWDSQEPKTSKVDWTKRAINVISEETNRTR